MGKLRDLVEQLEGEALVDALVEFDYEMDTEPVVDADPGTGDWYNQVEDRPLGGIDTFDELNALVATGALAPEVYAEVLERLAGTETQDGGATIAGT